MRRQAWFVACTATLAAGQAGCTEGKTRSLGDQSVALVTDAPETLDPTTIPRFVTPLVVPPVMPAVGKIKQRGGKPIDYYEIAVRQRAQQILPDGYPATTVWSYGSAEDPATFNSPSFTIEAKWRRPVRVKWINDLVDAGGDFLPHLLPVDQTLHWANPVRDCLDGVARTDCRGQSQLPYDGPVPIVTHVHGAETTEWSDGYPEAWFLPAARNLPMGIAQGGSLYETFAHSAALQDIAWEPGSATFQYPNQQRAATLWYHDHALGITRLNVYAGPAGFYIIRGGPGDEIMDTMTGGEAILPGPAPRANDRGNKRYREIPIAIQDRSFLADGSLAYPDNRAFFEGLDPADLQIPFIPDQSLAGGQSDVSPIWNPEFFGNTLMANGRTWPYLDVEPRRYRFRLLNGSQSRFLILELSNGGTFWQIGADGGLLPQPAARSRLLLGPAERADVIVDFAGLAVGTEVTLLNLGPDEPFGGGEPGVDFPPADPATTGRVMRFRVVAMTDPVDLTTPPQRLQLAARAPLPLPTATRRLSLNEESSGTVYVMENATGQIVEVSPDEGEPFGPIAAKLGTLDAAGMGMPMMWADPITETPAVGAVEDWEIHNFTMDAHPIHIHLVQFEIVGREVMGDPTAISAAGSNLPLPGEQGTKDTVIAYPDEITRVRAHFTLPGLFVWHCHILEHEDNEMMRPYCVGDSPGCHAVAHDGSHTMP